MTDDRSEHDFSQALRALESSDHGALEKVEMLVEVALGLQRKPRSPPQLLQAVELYGRAMSLCPEGQPLLVARLRAGKAGALRAIPGEGAEHLLMARAELEAALPVLRGEGASAEELADAEMSLGVVLHALAAYRGATLGDAIAAYQRATRVFDRRRYPREFAILQNNLATAYLSLPMLDERARLREALAVQAFGDALQVVSLSDDPVEYAMLQNNLGNALQYAASGHPLQNRLRALEAYAAALQVRNVRDMPVQYANTIANKANCLRNLPDDPERPEAGNRARLEEAAALYVEASQVFARHGELERAQLVERARAEIAVELDRGERLDGAPGQPVPATADRGFGVPRVDDA